MCANGHASVVHLQQLGTRHVAGLAQQPAWNIEGGWQVVLTERAEGIGVVVGPCVVEGQDHPTRAAFT